MLPAFLTTVLFAISGVSANRTTRLLGGVEANFWRISLATLLLALWAHTLGSGIGGRAFFCFLLSGCIGFGLGDLALYQTLPRLGSRLSILLVHCLAAPIAALIEWAWLGTTLTSLQVACSAMILLGVAIALAPGKQSPISKPLLVSGVMFGVTAAFGQGFGAVVSRKAYHIAALAGEHIDGLTAAYQRIMAGWAIGAITFLIMRQRLAALGLRPKGWTVAWKWILVNALAGPTLGVGCYQWALATQPTGVVLPVVAITPIIIIPLARVVDGERPSKRSLAGGALAVAGAFALAGGAKLVRRYLLAN